MVKAIKRHHFAPSEMTSNVSINPYQSDEMIKCFKKQLSRLIFWSSIMVDHHKSEYDIGKSSDVESKMNVTKNVIMKNVRLPTRADTFIKKLLQSSNGEVQSE